MKSVLVAVQNKQSSKIIDDTLRSEHGVETVEVIGDDGEAAWAALLANESLECLVVDWKIAKLSGAVIVNRMRAHSRLRDVPILVVSNLSQKENFTLLKDYHLTGLAEGSFSGISFSVKFGLLKQEFLRHQSDMAKIDVMLSSYKTDVEKAHAELCSLARSHRNPQPTFELAARILREGQLLVGAEKAVRESRKMGDTAAAVFEFARTLYAEGKPKEALSTLKKGPFSAKNANRFLLEGELSLQDGLFEDSKRAFTQAKALDAGCEISKDGLLIAENLAALLAGDKDAKTTPFPRQLELFGDVLLKANKQEDALRHYHAALRFLLEPLAKARTMYALGMIYNKGNDKAAALEWLEKSAALGGSAFPDARAQIKAIGPATKRAA